MSGSATAWAVYLLAGQGLVYLVTASLIGLPVRLPLGRASLILRALLYCPSCSSFWLGMAISYFSPFWLANLPFVLNVVLSGVVLMGVTSLLQARGWLQQADFDVENSPLLPPLPTASEAGVRRCACGHTRLEHSVVRGVCFECDCEDFKDAPA